jgi:hypothetical protein
MERRERFTVLPAIQDAIEVFIAERSRAAQGAAA